MREPVNNDEQGLMAWAKSARPGDRVSYHIGDLCIDRDRAWRLHIADGKEDTISGVARLAFRLAKSGDVHLVQRRIADGVFRYIAIRRAPRAMTV